MNEDNQNKKATKSNGADNEHEKMNKKECVKCKIIQKNSTLTEFMHEMLVSHLKSDLFSWTVQSDDEDFESEEKAHEGT